MVNVVPFLASFRWYAIWLREIMAGDAASSPVVAANKHCGMRGKDFSRCRIQSGREQLTLSIPIAGGSGSLKRNEKIPEVRISEHGNWRHVHLGALAAAYGRTPFFSEIMPEIEECYHTGDELLSRFNERLNTTVCGFILGETDAAKIALSASANERGREIIAEIDPEISIIDPLMHLGPSVLLPLLAFTTK